MSKTETPRYTSPWDFFLVARTLILDIKLLVFLPLAAMLHVLPVRANTPRSLDHTIWSVDCSSREVLLIDGEGRVTIEVASNQIYILASLQPIDAVRYQAVFIRPADLGRGGLSLDWKAVSTSQPVAVLSIDDAEHVRMTWSGFKNDFEKQLVDFPEPDFYEGTEVALTKCSVAAT